MIGGLFTNLDDEDEFDDPYDIEERYNEEDDGESVLEEFARLAAEIEAGRAQAPQGWKLDRPDPQTLVWTTPSGRRYASTLEGEPMPLP